MNRFSARWDPEREHPVDFNKLNLVLGLKIQSVYCPPPPPTPRPTGRERIYERFSFCEAVNL